MSPRLARLTAKDLIRILKRKGYIITGQTGSHAHLENPNNGYFTTIPIHAGKIIGPGLLKSILRQLGMSAEDLKD